MGIGLLFLALLQGPPTPAPLVLSTDPVVLLDNYRAGLPADCQGAPAGVPCGQTFVGIYYPPGAGPQALGYAEDPKPVFINLRGGNSNPPLPDMLGWFQNNVLPRGFVGVDPNYPVVGAGEGYPVAEAGVAELIQYLRHHADWLNIHPDRIFVFGRSFGAFLSLAVGLREDYADPLAEVAMHRESSRPNFILPYAALTDLTCLTSGAVQFDMFLQAYFPVALAPGATFAQKLVDSPVFWLKHPERFKRTYTPPMFLGYHMGFYHPCGDIFDPHDGYLGELMRKRIDEFVLDQNLPDLGLRSELLDTQDLWGYTAKMEKALDWCVAQLQPQSLQMYMPRPWDPLTAVGSVQRLYALGATPNSLVLFAAALETGPVFLPWCPEITLGLPTGVHLGWSTSDAQGRAELDVFVPPIVLGVPIVLNSADLLHCRVSQILWHTWK